MEERTLRVLEYGKILDLLADKTSSSLGRELAENLQPTDDPVVIQEMLKEVSECRSMREFGDQIPLGGIHDIRDAVRRADAGGVLLAEVLVNISATLRASRQIAAFFGPRKERAPLLADWALGLGDFRQLEREIDAAIGPGGEVLDSASPELGKIRTQIRTYQNRLKDKLDSMVRSADMQRYLQENLVTLRNDRYVLPVKQEYKAMVPGIVHDQSSSGATLFIEPMAVVELNNQLRQLDAAEQEEIRRILAELSDAVGHRAPEIRVSVSILAHLDFVTAKTKLAEDMRAEEPQIVEGAQITLVGARHPLLKGAVVPIDLELGCSFDTLVITGPNTGGKTVTLKTVGLLTLMAQSGLHVPARTGTALSVFSRVYSDIGDEQSIEQSLSTFSSHMTHIVDILAKSGGQDTLVLLDELGAGTDPTEGAALAMAILEHLHHKGVRTVATTHYAELKTFAYTTPGLQNASVEFDVETLRPTYRLILGTPGRSNAFEIAKRLGLPEELVDHARGMLSADHNTVEQLIENIHKDERAAREERMNADRLKMEYSRLVGVLAEKDRRLENEKETILRQAREKARQVIDLSRKEVEELIKLLKSEAAEKRLDEAAKTARTALNELRESMEQELGDRGGEKNISRPVPKGLKPGENVRAINLGREGVVLNVDYGNNQALVQFGIMKVNMALDEIERRDQRDQKKDKDKDKEHRLSAGGTKTAAMETSKALSISTELDLRGLTAEEALQTVDKYLDDALLAGIPRARIIHGKGTGALRTAIIAYLREHPVIRSFRAGESGEGGSGVTVVELQ